MDIRLPADKIGIRQARLILALIDNYAFRPQLTDAQADDLAELERNVLKFLERPEVAALLAEQEGPRRKLGLGERLACWWQALRGPSHREMTLSHQRMEALARAERAEHSTFEAVAESSRLREELAAAKAQLEALHRRSDS